MERGLKIIVFTVGFIIGWYVAERCQKCLR